jgi:cytoskeletal protein RodZ
MKTAGQMLYTSRLAKKMDLEEVARVTKIRASFLSAIEADDYTHLPNSAVAKGFIKNYSEFLGLNPNQILAVFRRDFVENQAGQIVPRGMVNPISRDNLWTPKTTIITTVSLIFVVFASYLIYQFYILTGPPPLSIDSPKSDIFVADSSIEVSGTTDPEATISVNNNLVALDKGGQFFVRIPLNLGPNQITVTATSKSGKNTSITRTVTLTSSP